MTTHCISCGLNIHQARASVGYNTCIKCSDKFVPKRQGLFIPDADGNIETRFVTQVDRLENDTFLTWHESGENHSYSKGYDQEIK